MPNLHYIDEDGSLKTIANTDSPNFTGEPTIVSKETHVERGVLNVIDAVKYIDSVIADFNETRFIFANSNKLTGLVKGKKYAVTVYGKFSPGSNDTYNLGPVAVRDVNDRVLKTSGNMVNNLVNPKNPINQNAVLIVDKVPDNGEVYGLVNYNTNTNTGTNATYMIAIRLS